MKKKIISLLLLTILIFSITSCGKSSDSDSNIVSSNYLPEDIILVSHYSNHAWVNQEEGWFLTGSGDIYKYDLYDESISVNSFKNQTYTRIDMMKKIQANSEPTKKWDSAKVEKIYQEGMQIDPNAEYTSKGGGCDMGLTTLEFYNNKTNEFILIQKTGDVEALSTDKHAQKVIDIIYME